MIKGKLKFSDYKDRFYDKFGNRINNYIVEQYSKRNETWHLEETIKTNAGMFYVVEEKFYFECNGSLIPLNMDFNSKDCYVCYKIVGEDTTEYVKIVGNEYLCKNEYLGLRLHRQDYSDGTCFYSLHDNRGKFRVNYGNHDVTELIKVLEGEIEIDMKYADVLPVKTETIEQKRKLIEDMKQYITMKGKETKS